VAKTAAEHDDWRRKVNKTLRDPDSLTKLSDPGFWLPQYGTILDQETERELAFRSDICPRVQHSIISYVRDAPRMDSGHTKWLAVIGPRQCTKSTTAVGALLPKVLYTPGTQGVTIADEQERADTLFEAAMFHYLRTPKSIRMPQLNSNAVRQLNLVHGGKYRALTSGFSGNTGLGRGVAWTHISEGPFHKDFATFWNKYYPSITNRKEAAVILESTPGAMTEPSAASYRDLMMDARQGLGRWLYVFAPFWTSLLNERPWPRDWKMSKDELDLMELYGPKDGGPLSRPRTVDFLTMENLAFLREVRVMNSKVRKDPGLLWVFYPKDDISCWHQVGSSAFPGHAMEDLLRRSGGATSLIEWIPTDGMYMEYQEPRSGAIYVIGVDPAGWGSGDPAAFQVLEVWREEVIQVAEFSSNVLDPKQFAHVVAQAARHFNDAHVFCENNGVGAGTIAILELLADKRELKNLHYYKKGKPGLPMTASRHKSMMAKLVDMSLSKLQGGDGTLVIKGRNLQAQLSTYRQDKEVQRGNQSQILRPTSVGAGRREKHHWDRVSAFLMAIEGVEHVPARRKPRTDVSQLPPLTPQTWNQIIAKTRSSSAGIVKYTGKG